MREIGSNWTAIERHGWKLFEYIWRFYEKIYEKFTPKIYTTIKVNTRMDNHQTFAEKVKSVLDN